MPNEPYPGTQAIQRALRLLKTFTDERPELGLSELSRLAGLNKATAYRMVSALEVEGLLSQNKDNEKYRLGPEAIALGGRALRHHTLRSAALPELERLAGETGETASLEVMVGDEVMILEEIPGQHLLGLSRSIGTRWPLHATSTGKAILAHMSEVEQERLMRDRLKALTPKTIADRESMRRELAGIRRQGYAIAEEELEPGFVAVGAPVLDRLGRPAGAISLGGPQQRLSSRRLAELGPTVRDAALAISQAIGWDSPPRPALR